MLHIIDAELPLSLFGIDPETLYVELQYNLKATYDKPHAKFSLFFSNSALVDCHYIFESFIASLKHNLEKNKYEQP